MKGRILDHTKFTIHFCDGNRIHGKLPPGFGKITVEGGVWSFPETDGIWHAINWDKVMRVELKPIFGSSEGG